MKSKILKIASWVILLGTCIFFWSFSNSVQYDTVCKNVVVYIDYQDENFFLDSKDVLETIKSNGDSLVGEKIEAIQINSLEALINEKSEVENCEVYKTINGELYFNIKQRRPIARIINYKNEGFYIDSNGKLMPLSENFTARVPVVTGDFSHTYAGNYYRNLAQDIPDSVNLNTEKDLLYGIFRITNFIDKSDFWKAQIEQINISENSIELIPKAGDNIILFGDANNIEEKFNKLFSFYKDGLSKVGWNKYDRIDLRYKGQIVARKKTELLKS